MTVVGLDGRPLGAAATAALAGARTVAGGRRHLEDLAAAGLLPEGARRVVLGSGAGRVLDELAGAAGPVVVLASGDPGFFGVVRALTARGGRPPAVVPAASSVALAFAGAGLAWDDALVVSAHGRDPARAVNACRRYPKVAVLTEPRFGPAELGAALRGLDRRLVVAERLGEPAQRVVETTPAGAAGRAWSDPNVVLVLTRDRGPGGASADVPGGGPGWAHPPRQAPLEWALDESAFDHRDGMVTKAEVRALALAWLGPGLGDLVWDVGAGSGSVAVECARLGAAAIAVEADSDQCARVGANAARHGVPVEVVQGHAPAVLAALPDPDTAFVGGGGAGVAEIARAVAGRVRRAVVVALATVERVGPVMDTLREAGLEVSGTAVHAARLAPLAGGHRLAATNPVVLVRGVRHAQASHPAGPVDPVDSAGPVDSARRRAGAPLGSGGPRPLTPDQVLGSETL